MSYLLMNPNTGSLFVATARPGFYRMVRAGLHEWIATNHVHDAGRAGPLVRVTAEVTEER